MSHFTVMITGENPDDQLQPYSEHITADKYEVGVVEQKDMDKMRKYYAEKDHRNALISFESLYKEYGFDWNSECWEKNVAGQWIEYSRYNPLSKWDWFQLGGRWSGMIKLKKGKFGNHGRTGAFNNKVGIDQAVKKDIKNLDEIRTFAYLINGKWVERGTMGWWGTVSDEIGEKQWTDIQQKLIDEIPDDALISIYDLHI